MFFSFQLGVEFIREIVVLVLCHVVVSRVRQFFTVQKVFIGNVLLCHQETPTIIRTSLVDRTKIKELALLDRFIDRLLSNLIGRLDSDDCAKDEEVVRKCFIADVFFDFVKNLSNNALNLIWRIGAIRSSPEEFGHGEDLEY